MAPEILTLAHRRAFSRAASFELEAISSEMLKMARSAGSSSSREDSVREVRLHAYGKRLEEIGNVLSLLGGDDDEIVDGGLAMIRRQLQYADECLDEGGDANG